MENPACLIICSKETARVIDGYMKDVVKSGTGTRARTDGLTIAGKTGSAEASIDGTDVTHAWFTGYIADDRYPYAVSVLVEEGGTGGSVAAPIAKQIFEYLRIFNVADGDDFDITGGGTVQFFCTGQFKICVFESGCHFFAYSFGCKILLLGVSGDF